MTQNNNCVVIKDVEDTARAIEHMEIRGAGRIARAGVAALCKVAEKHRGDRETLLIELEKAKERLLSSR
ncbi:MAG TPA: hypothetical protein HA366_01750, partial [Candidatus Methanomethylophilaceae archaeon]|nr:hypothetical protein [Candidatus Methanomethylophilaceae archaeon]